ncbi:TOBE domain-containing protein [Brucella anthropi]|nr:TOBE domain-containing protein [Brucella anthropi ATCC 49188]QQC26682.1 TOBE domain-containing protein [Brucella anthropi]
MEKLQSLNDVPVQFHQRGFIKTINIELGNRSLLHRAIYTTFLGKRNYGRLQLTVQLHNKMAPPTDMPRLQEGTPDGLSLTGTVTAVEPLGAETLVHLDVNGVSVIATAPGKIIPATGGTLSVSAPAGSLYLFNAKTEKSLGRL